MDFIHLINLFNVRLPARAALKLNEPLECSRTNLDKEFLLSASKVALIPGSPGYIVINPYCIQLSEGRLQAGFLGKSKGTSTHEALGAGEKTMAICFFFKTPH